MEDEWETPSRTHTRNIMYSKANSLQETLILHSMCCYFSSLSVLRCAHIYTKIKPDLFGNTHTTNFNFSTIHLSSLGSVFSETSQLLWTLFAVSRITTTKQHTTFRSLPEWDGGKYTYIKKKKLLYIDKKTRNFLRKTKLLESHFVMLRRKEKTYGKRSITIVNPLRKISLILNKKWLDRQQKWKKRHEDDEEHTKLNFNGMW